MFACWPRRPPVSSPDVRRWRADRHPVRSQYKNPGEPDLLPDPDAIIVAPATVNTINKWGAGICDTLALGILVEAIGKQLPVVAMPVPTRRTPRTRRSPRTSAAAVLGRDRADPDPAGRGPRPAGFSRGPGP